MDAATRLRQALSEGGKSKGFRGPKGEKQLLEVRAGDVAELAQPHAAGDPIARALYQGCTCLHEDAPVVVQADDLFHVLDLRTDL